MIIRVLYEDDSHDYVPAFRLDDLISRRQNKESSIALMAGSQSVKTRLRGLGRSKYSGPERRKIYAVGLSCIGFVSTLSLHRTYEVEH